MSEKGAKNKILNQHDLTITIFVNKPLHLMTLTSHKQQCYPYGLHHGTLVTNKTGFMEIDSFKWYSYPHVSGRTKANTINHVGILCMICISSRDIC